MYRYQEPVLRLRPAEQKLLAAALAGKTDAELSADLGLSIEAIKKRWMSIFARVDEFKPEILSSGRSGERRTRTAKAAPRCCLYPNSSGRIPPFSWERSNVEKTRPARRNKTAILSRFSMGIALGPHLQHHFVAQAVHCLPET